MPAYFFIIINAIKESWQSYIVIGIFFVLSGAINDYMVTKNVLPMLLKRKNCFISHLFDVPVFYDDLNPFWWVYVVFQQPHLIQSNPTAAALAQYQQLLQQHQHQQQQTYHSQTPAAAAGAALVPPSVAVAAAAAAAAGQYNLCSQAHSCSFKILQNQPSLVFVLFWYQVLLNSLDLHEKNGASKTIIIKTWRK